MIVATSEGKAMVRFTVDLPLSMHLALTDLAMQQRSRKAALVRVAIAELSLNDEIRGEAQLTEPTKRFTLDMELEAHEEFSILAIKMHRSKAELARWAIGQLFEKEHR